MYNAWNKDDTRRTDFLFNLILQPWRGPHRHTVRADPCLPALGQEQLPVAYERAHEQVSIDFFHKYSECSNEISRGKLFIERIVRRSLFI